jgi:hypothetical protein
MTSLERLKKLKQAQRESEVPGVPEPVEIFRPEPQPIQQISDEDQILIDWFLTAALPTEAFNLDCARRVTDPAKFFDSLRREVAGRQSSPRWRCGATQADLRSLKLLLSKY